MGMYFTSKEKYIYVAIICILTATGSLTAQYLTSYCTTCTIGATLFMLTGIINLAQDKATHLKTNFVLISTLIIGLFFLNSMFQYYQNPIILNEDSVISKKNHDVALADTIEKRALLYISPTCNACKLFIDHVVEYDIKGEKCIIVTTPIRSLAQTEQKLREKGYTGKVVAATKAPTGFVPVLINGKEVLRGEEIINYLKGVE